MSLHRIGQWGCRGGHRQVFRYEKEHRHRMGHCSRLPKIGDLCIRIADAGDCFHDYIAMRPNEDGQYVRAFEFSAYVFGEPLCKLDERTFHLACAGEPVEIKVKER